jgi:hypothetical protein
MTWIEDENTFKSSYKLAHECAAIDSGRLPSSLQKLAYNDVDILSDAFPELIQKLLEWSSDDRCTFVVIRPHPVHYFYHYFKRYPVIQINRGMKTSDYLAILNEAPPDSKPDALGIIYSEYVFAPQSMRWFVHALRSERDDGGHLWIPAEWVDRIRMVYPYTSATLP